ncbi:cyclodeaminase/cyclohydrolase family protein [Pseudomonas saudiphocaensis]|uniref:Formiminotransferase-cyclodeaminase n=1 Tax=Pseudomonas saudiphocaensis TaxID=1499686 RepID=A0A078LSS6_9PSED|nr:cyclodeaminase/cyclohydrolase family protein [Pseudomonas saudiphocaensis]CDZ95473.1 Formiminotransferase-cyclodeaminase [Pseudomonas saudiphocaensis]
MTETNRPGAGEQLWEMTLAQFRTACAERALPGCGAVAAVVADFGLALVVKALRVSEERESRAERGELLHSAQALLSRPGAFADDDVAVFQGYLDAEGDEARQAAARQACAVPLATARACNEALAIAEAAWPETVESLRCDVQGGALLIGAAVDAVLLNVEVDLEALESPSARQALLEMRDKLQSEARAYVNRIASKNV